MGIDQFLEKKGLKNGSDCEFSPVIYRLMFCQYFIDLTNIILCTFVLLLYAWIFMVGHTTFHLVLIYRVFQPNMWVILIYYAQQLNCFDSNKKEAFLTNCYFVTKFCTKVASFSTKPWVIIWQTLEMNKVHKSIHRWHWSFFGMWFCPTGPGITQF